MTKETYILQRKRHNRVMLIGMALSFILLLVAVLLGGCTVDQAARVAPPDDAAFHILVDLDTPQGPLIVEGGADIRLSGEGADGVEVRRIVADVDISAEGYSAAVDYAGSSSEEREWVHCIQGVFDVRGFRFSRSVGCETKKK